MRHIGVMGGAFNPPHFGHLLLAQCALDEFQLEKVIFVPSGTPPHKKSDILDKEQRFEMVAAAVANNPAFEASRLEVDRLGVTWTIDTLQALQAQLGPDVRLNFIIGEDNIQSLVDYDRRSEFVKLCRLLVSPREKASTGQLERWRQTLPEAEIELVDCPVNSISSTLVRNYIRAGRSIHYLVPPSVCRIIEQKGHYKATLAQPTESTTAPTPATAQA